MAEAKNVEQKKFLSKLTPEDVGGKTDCVRFVLGNGVEVVGDLSAYSEKIIKALALHGLSQKIGDAASGFSKTRDFHGAFGAMQGVEDNLRNELWSSKAGGGSADLVKALAILQGVSLEDVQTAVDKMDEDMLKQVKAHPQVKAKIAEIQAERAKEAAKAPSPDLGDLMKGIGL